MGVECSRTELGVAVGLWYDAEVDVGRQGSVELRG